MKLPAGVVPKTKLDQHFLIDEGAIRRMIDAAGIQRDDSVVDVGAGIGTITEKIPECKSITAIELDKDLIPHLKKLRDVRVIEGNALAELKRIKFDVLLSNLPYTISEPLMRLLFTLRFRQAVLLLPKNFTKRILDNENKIGFLSQQFFTIEVLEEVMPASYEPQPDIISCMVRLTPKPISASQSFLLQDDKLVKNAIIGALTQNGDFTKRHARKAMTEKGFGDLLDYPVKSLCLEDLHKIVDFLEGTSLHSDKIYKIP